MSEADRYIAGLGAALRGPRRIKADLLAEARHGLLDAAEAHRDRGLDAERAERLAIAEFGAPADVLPGYQAELAVAQGRRTALLIALALPLLHLLAPLMWWRGPWQDHGAVTAGYFRLADGFDDLSLAGTALAVLAWLCLGWGSRYVPADGMVLTRVLGRGALAFLAVHGMAGGAVYLWSVAQWPGAMFWPPLWIGALVMSPTFAYAAVCAWRCLAAARVPVIEEGLSRRSVVA